MQTRSATRLSLLPIPETVALSDNLTRIFAHCLPPLRITIINRRFIMVIILDLAFANGRPRQGNAGRVYS
jgi:hypothetical protein